MNLAAPAQPDSVLRAAAWRVNNPQLGNLRKCMRKDLILFFEVQGLRPLRAIIDFPTEPFAAPQQTLCGGMQRVSLSAPYVGKERVRRAIEGLSHQKQ